MNSYTDGLLIYNLLNNHFLIIISFVYVLIIQLHYVYEIVNVLGVITRSKYTNYIHTRTHPEESTSTTAIRCVMWT